MFPSVGWGCVCYSEMSQSIREENREETGVNGAPERGFCFLEEPSWCSELPDVYSETSVNGPEGPRRTQIQLLYFRQLVSQHGARERGGERLTGNDKENKSEERAVTCPVSCFTVWFHHLINLDRKR